MSNSKALATKPLGTVEVPEITPGDARKALPEDRIAALHNTMDAAFVTQAKNEHGLMWAASLVVVNAVDYSAVVRQGKAKDESDTRPTQGDYAKMRHLSSGYVSRLLRVGRAITRHGVRQGSTTYALLASHASDTVWNDILGLTLDEYQKAPKATDEAFKAMVAAYASNDGKAPKAVGSGQAPGEGARTEGDGTEGEGERQEKSEKGDGIPSTPADIGLLIEQVLAVGMRRLSDDEAETVHKHLYRVIKSDRDRRKVEKAARDAAADSDETPVETEVEGETETEVEGETEVETEVETA